MSQKPFLQSNTFDYAVLQTSMFSGRCWKRASKLLLYLLLIFALTIVGPITGTGVAQDNTSIEAEVNGEQLTEGGEFVVREDPSINISTEPDSSIKFVEIRVNGEIQRTYQPDNRSFAQSVPLELGLNENTVEVIVSADSVSTFTTTLTKRTAAPRIKYSSPFTTSVLGGPDNETEVSTGRVTLAGTLHTETTVEHISIEQAYFGNSTDVSNETAVSRELHQIDNPGDSFSQDLMLGSGVNEIKAQYTDTYGDTNTDQFRLVVEDKTDPVVNFSAPDVSYSNSAQLRGTVKDDTKIDRVEVNRTTNNASRVLLGSTNTEPDPDRISFEMDTKLRLYDNNTQNEFRLVAEDSSGNTNEKTFSIEYDSEPQVNVTNSTINASGEAAHITGNVSKAQITRVSVESINASSGERLDIKRAYDVSSPVDNVSLDQTLIAATDQTAINIIVIYDGGDQYTETITLQSKEEPVNDDMTETNRSEDTQSNRSEDTQSNRSEDTQPNRSEDTQSNTTVSNNTDTTSESKNNTSSVPEESPRDGSNGPESNLLGTLLGIGTREVLASNIIIGVIYILDHKSKHS